MITFEEWKTKANSLGLFSDDNTAYRYFMSIRTGRFNLAMVVLVGEFRYRNNYLERLTTIITDDELKDYADSTGLTTSYIASVESDPLVSLHNTIVIRISQLFYDDGYNLNATMINQCVMELTVRILSLDYADKVEFIRSAEEKVSGRDLSTIGKLVEAYILQQFLKHSVNGMDDTDEKPVKSRITKLIADTDDYKPRVIAAKGMLLNRRNVVSYSDLEGITDMDSFTKIINDIRFLLKLTELADVIEVV